MAAPVSPRAGLAIDQLARVAPGSLSGVLEQALDRRDTPMVATILAALLDAGSGPIWDEQAERDWGSPTGKALALLIGAGGDRFPAAGSEEEDLLQRIPLGWGSLSPLHEAQAAWLVVSREGREAELLVRILSTPD
ncbi:MAG: hypothetical protein AAGB34_09170 [Planctomycetota bacterium]